MTGPYNDAMNEQR